MAGRAARGRPRPDRLLRRVPRRRSGGRTCRERPPAALVLRSPFTSLADVGAVHYPWLPVRRLLLDRYPSIDRIGRWQSPVLVIAGDRDDIVPAIAEQAALRRGARAQALRAGTRRRPQRPRAARRSPDAGGDRAVPVGDGCDASDTGRVKPAICEQFGIDFPLFAFSHCRDVVAAVTNAGGFGVLGGDGVTPRTARPGAVVDRRPRRRQAVRRRHHRAREVRGQGREAVARRAGRPDPEELSRLRRRAARRRTTSSPSRRRALGRSFAVRRHRPGPARGGDEPSDQVDRQRAGGAAGLHDRRGQGARHPRRRAGRRQGARRQAGRRPAWT